MCTRGALHLEVDRPNQDINELRSILGPTKSMRGVPVKGWTLRNLPKFKLLARDYDQDLLVWFERWAVSIHSPA